MSAKEVSLPMTIVLVFITHSVVNTLLLMPWNSIRCSFWNLYECNADENWILNWLAFSRFHVLILLICLARTSMGNNLFEKRLLVLCNVLMLNFVSTGIFAIDLMNKPMAVLQCIIYMLLLALSLHHLTTCNVIPLPSQLRSSSFDFRRRMPISSAALGIQCFLAMMRVSDMTLGKGREGYTGDNSSPVYRIVSHAYVNDMFFAALILGIFFMIGTALLAGSQGERIDSEQVKAGGVTTFLSIIISVLGVS
eukprot:scaffold34656_cov178-Amphora_coffeaeformis.AAC.18